MDTTTFHDRKVNNFAIQIQKLKIIVINCRDILRKLHPNIKKRE